MSLLILLLFAVPQDGGFSLLDSPKSKDDMVIEVPVEEEVVLVPPEQVSTVIDVKGGFSLSDDLRVIRPENVEKKVESVIASAVEKEVPGSRPETFQPFGYSHPKGTELLVEPNLRIPGLSTIGANFKDYFGSDYPIFKIERGEPVTVTVDRNSTTISNPEKVAVLEEKVVAPEKLKLRDYAAAYNGSAKSKKPLLVIAVRSLNDKSSYDFVKLVEEFAVIGYVAVIGPSYPAFDKLIHRDKEFGLNLYLWHSDSKSWSFTMLFDGESVIKLTLETVDPVALSLDNL